MWLVMLIACANIPEIITIQYVQHLVWYLHGHTGTLICFAPLQ